MTGRCANKVPEIALDEALRLYLSFVSPGGLPEGEAGDELLRKLREKIAKDRPEWAGSASNEEGGTAGGTSSPKTYSEIKARIVEEAAKEDIPADPEERYLYNRRKDARENRERRQQEDRENAVREDLRRRLIANRNEADEKTLDTAIQIRRAIERRVRESLDLDLAGEKETAGTDKNESGKLLPEQVQFTHDHELSLPSGEKDQNEIAFSHGTTPLENSFSDNPTTDEQLSPAQMAKALRDYNHARREMLKPREEYVLPRRFHGEGGADDALTFKEKDQVEGFNLAVSEAATNRKKSLSRGELPDTARARESPLKSQKARERTHQGKSEHQARGNNSCSRGLTLASLSPSRRRKVSFSND